MIGVDIERTLQNIHGTMAQLTNMIPMVQVKDLLEETQRHVVGIFCKWVRLFRSLENVVVCYHDHHPDPYA